MSLSYEVIKGIEAILIETGYEVFMSRERLVGLPKYPGEVYSNYSRTLSEEKYHSVDIYMYYVPEGADKTISYLRIDVQNNYYGSVLEDVKKEIDRMGDLLYQELEKITNPEKIHIERKKTVPPYFV